MNDVDKVRCNATVRVRFGTWNAGIRAAGLTVRRRGTGQERLYGRAA